MADCRQQQWACKIPIETSTSAPKLCSLPPTTVSFEQYFRRAHHQVALWYSALSGDEPALNAVEYGWEWHDTNIRLLPRNVSDVVSYAPWRHHQAGQVAAWNSNRFAQCFVVVTVALPVQIHSMVQLISRMTVIQTVMVTLLTWDNDKLVRRHWLSLSWSWW